jgi:hypothetical protein
MHLMSTLALLIFVCIIPYFVLYQHLRFLASPVQFLFVVLSAPIAFISGDHNKIAWVAREQVVLLPNLSSGIAGFVASIVVPALTLTIGSLGTANLIGCILVANLVY